MSTNSVIHQSTIAIPPSSAASAPISQSFADRAALVVAYGIPVVPLLPRTKDAFLTDWTVLATTDEVQIAAWNEENPAYNCASVMRRKGHWAFEVDNPDVYAQVERDTGHSLHELDTFVVNSSGEKFHFYFQHDARSEAMGNFDCDDESGERFSVRASNKYVVSPGSIHPKTGQPYRLVKEPAFGEIPPAPDWLMDWLLLQKSKKAGGIKTAAPIPEIISDGARNKTLTSMAGSMRRRGANREEILAALQVMNQRCQPSVDDSELETIAGSVARYTPAAPIPVDTTQQGTSALAPTIARPTLDEAVFYGLPGRIIKKLEPQSESHPAGTLIELLISIGNAIGRGPYYQVEDSKHFTNEFAVMVGESAKARKGTAKNRIRAVMRMVDSEWLDKRCTSGVGSGEVIIHFVRDPRMEWFFDKKKGTGQHVMTDSGVEDKRACISLGEFQGILAVCHRSDSLLPVVLRDAWDGLPLKNMVKSDPASCSEGLISVLADVTRADLSVSLTQADRNNGFANRFLWVYVHRTKLLAMGGDELDWTAEACALRECIEFARGVRRMFMDEAARKMWTRTLYPKLERDVPGIVGAIIARASAHVIRLAMLYALLDKSDRICVEHLEAAVALWQYCEDSAQAIFGELLTPDQTKLVEFLVAHGPATKKTLIHDCFRRNRPADLIQADLDFLNVCGKVAIKDDEAGVPFYSARQGS